MTNPSDRLWLVIGANGDVPFVAKTESDANAESSLLDTEYPACSPHVVHEYRLHRPINWRTGVPDAEMVKRHDNLFALLLHDGSTLRECSLLLGGEWYWGGAGTGTRAINPNAVEVCWCPEDEMPEEREEE